MSAYNAERFVGDAVQSALRQTFDDFEFLIFEDKSTDATLHVLRTYTDRRIRLVENIENRGLTKNLISGMAMARGEFVARMDADDTCMPHRLAIQVAHMDKNPNISVLGSAVTFFTETGKEFIAHQPLEHEEIKCALFYGFTMLHPSVMMRRADLERHGLNYDSAFPVSQDHDLWTRAIRKVRFANLHEPLLRMREHEGKIGRYAKSRQLAFSNIVRQRQMEEFGMTVGADELRLFCEHEMPGGRWTSGDVKTFETLLLRIFDANAAVRLFDQGVLMRMGIVRLRETCRQLLIAGNSAGRYYWHSRLRQLDTPSMRQVAGLALRSLGVSWR